ncbi:MAG: HD domain-containing protein [Erysipelotrichaceae bacterium]|nr:HD domain-containing protein [Erysipelotrichaceae bacterium]
MSLNDRKEFAALIKKYTEDPKVRQLEGYTAHGKISVFSHSLSVAETAYKLDKALKTGCDLDVLLTGALLHDYYLYDWHDARLFVNVFKMHGFTHPEKARENAVRDFGVDERVQKVIRCHMWPLTFRSFPSSREAMLVCLADKICALKETVLRW